MLRTIGIFAVLAALCGAVDVSTCTTITTAGIYEVTGTMTAADTVTFWCVGY